MKKYFVYSGLFIAIIFTGIHYHLLFKHRKELRQYRQHLEPKPNGSIILPKQLPMPYKKSFKSNIRCESSN